MPNGVSLILSVFQNSPRPSILPAKPQQPTKRLRIIPIHHHLITLSELKVHKTPQPIKLTLNKAINLPKCPIFKHIHENLSNTPHSNLT